MNPGYGVLVGSSSRSPLVFAVAVATPVVEGAADVADEMSSSGRLWKVVSLLREGDTC